MSEIETCCKENEKWKYLVTSKQDTTTDYFRFVDGFFFFNVFFVFDRQSLDNLNLGVH